MPLYLIATGLIVSACSALFFSTLSYSLRDFTRSRLQERLERFGKSDQFDRTADNASDLIFVTAICRLLSNLLVLICALRLFHDTHHPLAVQYTLAVLVAASITLFTSVAIPNAAAKYAGETLIAFFVTPLHALRIALSPASKIMHLTDELFRRASGANETTAPEQIEEEILSAVDEGAKEGLVDPQERQMIKSVIELRETVVGQCMTARPEIVAIQIPAKMADVKQIFESSGHSRIPAFEGTLDHIVGILYARDLLQYIGHLPEHFDLRAALRPPLYVPESKPMRDLLRDFRLQKVHIAVVLDEYGGTAGLVTIEDILEELVGDIIDEHETHENPMLKRLNDHAWEADARVYINELNRSIGLTISEDAGYDTLGGFVSTTLGRIPPTGTQFENAGARYTVLDAEPQKVNRIQIELILEPADTQPTV